MVSCSKICWIKNYYAIQKHSCISTSLKCLQLYLGKLSTYILCSKVSGLQEKYVPKNHTVHTVNCWGKYGPALPLYNIPVSDCCLEYGLWTPLGTHSSGIRILGHHISSYTLANRLRLSTVCSIFCLHNGCDC